MTIADKSNNLKTERSFFVPCGLQAGAADLRARFAAALAEKMHHAQKKLQDDGYEGDEWEGVDWSRECSQQLLDHIAKGDPRDVAIYCAFIWHHGWRTSITVRWEIEPKLENR